MNITRCLTISTAHITHETALALTNGDEVGVAYYTKDDCGWWIYTDVVINKYLPDDLAKCLRVAIAYKCEWLCLDCDEEVLDRLPAYEW